MTTVAGSLIKSVVEFLLEKCIESPVAPRLGGTTISNIPLLKNKARKRSIDNNSKRDYMSISKNFRFFFSKRLLRFFFFLFFLGPSQKAYFLENALFIAWL